MRRGSIFRNVSMPVRKRTNFNLSFENKLSGQMGKLIPMFIKEVVPGDTFKVNSSFLIRFAPMLAPIMHRVDAFVHYFFVPNRLIWNEWKEFITGGEDGTAQPEMPYVQLYQIANYVQDGGLCDYLGVPYCSGSSSIYNKRISTLPFRAYQLIYNEYYRDQNLSNPVEISLDSGAEKTDFVELFKLRNRCWEKDYFTSALPWTQRGAEVTIPLGGDIPVTVNVPELQVTGVPSTKITSATGLTSPYGIVAYEQKGSSEEVTVGAGNGSSEDGNIDHPFQVEVSVDGVKTAPKQINGTGDLSNSTAVDMNSLRRAMRLQEWLERNARGGARYIEQILSHFGVRSSDARLQRPEYLGGGKTPVVISEVLQTSASLVDETPQGNMSGRGVSVGNNNGFKRFFEEHGFVIGIISILPRTCYQQGLHKMFQRMDKLDYYFPEFAHLGEQEVKLSELYLDTLTADTTFGYQSRYAEYKYCADEVHGTFKSSLDYWHLGRKFSNPPALNSEFVETDSETLKRIFAVRDVDGNENIEDIYIDIFHDFKAKRIMPKYGTPHF